MIGRLVDSIAEWMVWTGYVLLLRRQGSKPGKSQIGIVVQPESLLSHAIEGCPAQTVVHDSRKLGVSVERPFLRLSRIQSEHQLGIDRACRRWRQGSGACSKSPTEGAA